MTRDPGWRFWIVTAAVSACGTLSSMLTAFAPHHPLLQRAAIPSDVVEVFVMLTFLAALGASAAGFWSLMAVGVREAGGIAAICVPAYAAPWMTLTWVFMGRY